ncbi:DHHA1 domain-containing protein [soil metagenome]
MPCDWAPLVELIRKSDRILLMTHIRPDADGLGSQLALRDALVTLGKTVRLVIGSPLAPRYRFLDPDRTIIENFALPGDAFSNIDCIIVMDTGTWGQLGEFGDWMKTMTVPKAVVDHHRTQDDLGGQAFVDITAEATGRMAYEIITALGVPVSAYAAHNMFMALALDTGWFRHPNTTAATYALASELVKAGANPTPLYEQLFECAPLARLKLTGVALSRLQVVNNGLVAFTEVKLADYKECGAVPGDTEDLINYPRAIDGVEVAMIFIEQPEGGTKVSFRSRSKVDVSKLAEQYNGGGHKLASGARLPNRLEESKTIILNAVSKLL